MVSFVSIALLSASALFVMAFAGEFTYYNDKGYGACGTQIDASSQLLAAVSQTLWTASNPNNDPLCKKCVEVQYKGKK